MRPGGSPLWPELARLGELVQAVLLVTAGAAALVVTVVGVHQIWRGRPLRRPRGAVHWRVHHRAVRNFADAVAAADLDRADAMVGRTLGSHRRPDPRRHQPGSMSWDETVVMVGSRVDAAAQLRHRQGLAAWCRGVRRMPGSSGDILVVSRYHPLRLKLLSHRWLSHGGLRVSADVGGAVVVGQLTLQPGPAARHDETGRVEVWVHLEGPAGWRARRLLRRLRRVTRRGLRRWAHERTWPSPSDDRPRWFTRRPDTR